MDELKDETYFIFVPSSQYDKNVYLKVNRPSKFFHRDEDIGNRIYEKAIGNTKTDDWTKEMDAFIEMENITYEVTTKDEIKKKLNKKDIETIDRL